MNKIIYSIYYIYIINIYIKTFYLFFKNMNFILNIFYIYYFIYI